MFNTFLYVYGVCYKDILFLLYQKFMNMLCSYTMECNKLFYTDQYGIRPGHSTELAAAKFVNALVVDMDN